MSFTKDAKARKETSIGLNNQAYEGERSEHFQERSKTRQEKVKVEVIYG